MMAWKKTPKYHNKKTTLDGEVFDSRKEARRWSELQLLQKAGMITGLRRQVPFPLIPSQVYRENGKKKTERPVQYIADFVYYDNEGRFIVEDTKGVRTREYILKRKMMLFFHKIHIMEV